jgi:hypothetical protein
MTKQTHKSLAAAARVPPGLLTPVVVGTTLYALLSMVCGVFFAMTGTTEPLTQGAVAVAKVLEVVGYVTGYLISIPLIFGCYRIPGAMKKKATETISVAIFYLFGYWMQTIAHLHS